MIDIDGFRQFLYEEEMSKNTVISYLHSVELYAAKYDEITKGNLIEYKQEQLAKYKPSTVNLRIAGMMCYCRYVKDSTRLKTIKMPTRTNVENVITQEQLDTLIRCLDEDGKRCWIVNVLLLAKTGMRISEAMRIKKSDIEAGYVEMHTKGHMRTIYFPKSLVEDIWEDISNLSLSDQVVRCCGPGRKSRKTSPIRSTAGFRNSLNRIGVKYGLPKEVLHPHAFRHYFALEFLKNNGDIALLSDVLGHRSIDMTRIYLRRSQEQLKDAVDRAVKW